MFLYYLQSMMAHKLLDIVIYFQFRQEEFRIEWLASIGQIRSVRF